MTVVSDPAPRVRATTLDPSVLPKARALTDLVLGGPTPRPDLDEAEAAGLRRRLAAALERAVGAQPPDGGRRCLRLGAFQISLAFGDEGPAADEGPFRWSARTARRTVGLAAVRALLQGAAATPADAAAVVVADARRLGGGEDPRPGSCAAWAASLGPSARAVVRAEGTTWATQLWTALDWDRLPGADVGPPDRWWASPGPVRVALRGRADVRTGPHGRGGAHVLLLPGTPGEAHRASLGLSALVDLLTGGPPAAPGRVVGWWPECGRAWALDVDGAFLGRVARAVVRAAEASLARGDGRR